MNLLLELLFSNVTPVQMFIVRTVLMIKDKVITCCLLLITMVKLSIQRFLKLPLARWLPIAVFQVKIINFGFQSIMHTIVSPVVKSTVLISHRFHHYNSTLSSSQQSRLVAVQWNHYALQLHMLIIHKHTSSTIIMLYKCSDPLLVFKSANI